MTDEESQTEAVDRTVRRVRGQWYRAGVPRRMRRSRADELRDHLVAALDDGQRVQDVTGPDLDAFAAEWAQADRSKPLAEPLLWAVGLATLAPGLLALLGPLVFGHERTGFDSGSVTLLGSVLAMVLAIQVFRWRRHRLTPRQALAAVAGIGVGYLVLAVPVLTWGQAADVFVSVPPVVAVALVAVGLATQLLLTLLKTSQRL